MKTLQEIALKPILVLRQNTAVQDVAKAMCNKDVGCALLSDEHGHIVGIVTDRDLICASLAKGLWPLDPVHKIMSASLIYALEDSFVSEAIDLMKAFGIRRLPILRPQKNGKQRCVGILTVDDLILEKSVSIDDLSLILNNQLLPNSSFRIKKETARKSHYHSAEIESYN